MTVTIEERVKCPKCGETIAVLVGVSRTPDEDGPIADGLGDFVDERLWLTYRCKSCRKITYENRGGL